MMIGAFLPFVFCVPGYLGYVLWPTLGESEMWKLVSILSGATLFVAMKASDLFFSALELQHKPVIDGKKVESARK